MSTFNRMAAVVYEGDWFLGRTLAEKWLDGDAVVRKAAINELAEKNARTMAFAVHVLQVRVIARHGPGHEGAVVWEFCKAVSEAPSVDERFALDSRATGE